MATLEARLIRPGRETVRAFGPSTDADSVFSHYLRFKAIIENAGNPAGWRAEYVILVPAGRKAAMQAIVDREFTFSLKGAQPCLTPST